MPLVRLLYASKMNFADEDQHIAGAILETAHAHNAQKNITGLLAMRNGQFLQALEGSRGDILSLYESIARDPRHREMLLMHFSEVSARSFYRWSMGYIRKNDLPSNIHLYFGGAEDFTFLTMRSDHAMSFLLYCAQKDFIAAE